MKPIKPKKMPKALEKFLLSAVEVNAGCGNIDAKDARAILAALAYERARAEEWAKTANEATQSVLRLTRPIRLGPDRQGYTFKRTDGHVVTPDFQREQTEAVVPKPRKKLTAP